MDVQYLADKATVDQAKAIRKLSITALIIAGAYLLEGMFSVLFALIPIPILGFLISMVLSLIEFGLLIASVIFGIMALVRSCKQVKQLTALPDNEEKAEALGYVKLARTLSTIAVILTGASFLILSVLNVFEFFLSLF